MKKRKKHGWFDRLLMSPVFLIGMMLVGVLILFYPIISDRYYTVKQNEVIRNYEDMLEKLPTEEGKRILEQAETYNRHLAGLDQKTFYSDRKLDTITQMMSDGSLPAYFRPESLVGTVEIPCINVKLPLYAGNTDKVLNFAAGYMLNTSLPIGGPSTHCVITAHRGLPEARLFTDLDQVKIGDVFYVQVLDHPHAYRVDYLDIIEPDDTSSLGIVPGKDYITLLSCHPYMVNSKRLTVRGHRIPYTPELVKKVEQEKRNDSLRLFLIKYKEYFIGIGIFILLVIGWKLKERRDEHRKEKRNERKDGQSPPDSAA